MEKDTGDSDGPLSPVGCRLAVEIRELDFHYPGSRSAALSGVDLHVREGEFFGITGPSGSGKSTLAMCFNGLVPFHTGGQLSGEIRINGEIIVGRKPVELAGHIGMVFQDPDMQLCFPRVREELTFGPENLCLPREEVLHRVENIPGALGIESLLEREVNSLSGGQRQMVALAAVLVMQPRILVLDEPTAQLDSHHRRMVMNVLMGMRGRTTIVLITHDTGLLTGCDRVAVLDGGKLRAMGTPARLFCDRNLMEDTGLEKPLFAVLAGEIAMLRSIGGIDPVDPEIESIFRQLVVLQEGMP